MRDNASTCMGILRHACIRLSPRTSRCEDDFSCSTVSCAPVSATCRSESTPCRQLQPATYHQCLQSADKFTNELMTQYTKNNWTIRDVTQFEFEWRHQIQGKIPRIPSLACGVTPLLTVLCRRYQYTAEITDATEKLNAHHHKKTILVSAQGSRTFFFKHGIFYDC